MSADSPLLEVVPRRRVAEHFRDVWAYRELQLGLVRQQLKVRYKGSVLGFVWSLLNPLLYLVVFYFVFQVFLGSGIPSFPIFLLSGLLVWNLFVGSLPSAAGSIIDNGSLVKKVWFPREILPIASVGACTSSCSSVCSSPPSRSCGTRWRGHTCGWSSPRSSPCSYSPLV
jgi:ABC-2 type transport system permease protein